MVRGLERGTQLRSIPVCKSGEGSECRWRSLRGMGAIPWISSAPQGRADLLHVINSVLFLCEGLTYLAVSVDDKWHSRHASAEDRHRRRCWPLRSRPGVRRRV
jgi:hypothetical protein